MVENATVAIKTVSSNFKLAKLFEIILNMGNFLNFNTYAGNAFGFTPESLLKMRDTKSTKQNDYTVLHYLVQYITENRGKLLGFVDDMDGIGKGNTEFVNQVFLFFFLFFFPFLFSFFFFFLLNQRILISD